DGLYDNVIRAERDIMVNRLIIQHTDKANMNIRIDIPQTTLDHIFGFVPGGIDASYFNVYSKERRDMLLGEEVKENGEMTTSGYLDRGIKYLLDAETLVGAQIAHMDSANNNIITARENTQSSESTIRDADMAQAMTEYTKNNVLLSASQSMLAQANQNSSSVLSLLQ
ncbi:MAG: flagellin, partial [Selenomonadaceae bacterium]